MTLFILKYIFIASVFALYINSFCLCLIYNKVYVITFLKKSYACNFLKVASV